VTVGSSVAAGTHYAYIRLGDNTQAASYSFTVPSTATTTTASTGTGGSLGSITGTSTKITKTYTSVTPDLPKTITATDLADTGTMLTEIFFDVKETVTSVDISVEKLAGKPADVAAVIGTVYKYINISQKNLEDSNLESAYIKFKIEKSWITNNSIDSSTIALYRYANGQWNKLPTEQTSSDGNYLYFKTTVPGFSYFAIMSQSTSVTTTAVTTTTAVGATTTTPPTVLAAGQTTTMIVIAVIIIVVAILAIFLLKGKIIKRQ
jgi:PGF-pre-PGF domain-containing protein